VRSGRIAGFSPIGAGYRYGDPCYNRADFAQPFQCANDLHRPSGARLSKQLFPPCRVFRRELAASDVLMPPQTPEHVGDSTLLGPATGCKLTIWFSQPLSVRPICFKNQSQLSLLYWSSSRYHYCLFHILDPDSACVIFTRRQGPRCAAITESTGWTRAVTRIGPYQLANPVIILAPMAWRHRPALSHQLCRRLACGPGGLGNGHQRCALMDIARNFAQRLASLPEATRSVRRSPGATPQMMAQAARHERTLGARYRYHYGSSRRKGSGNKAAGSALSATKKLDAEIPRRRVNAVQPASHAEDPYRLVCAEPAQRLQILPESRGKLAFRPFAVHWPHPQSALYREPNTDSIAEIKQAIGTLPVFLPIGGYRFPAEKALAVLKHTGAMPHDGRVAQGEPGSQ